MRIGDAWVDWYNRLQAQAHDPPTSPGALLRRLLYIALTQQPLLDKAGRQQLEAAMQVRLTILQHVCNRCCAQSHGSVAAQWLLWVWNLLSRTRLDCVRETRHSIRGNSLGRP